MDEHVKRRLLQIGKLSAEGGFGAAVQAASEEYADLPVGMETLVTFVNDFYTSRPTPQDAEIANIADLFCRLIVVVYRDAKKHDPTIASALVNSFLNDYPGVTGSCLFSRWETLAHASLAFKASGNTEPILVWEQAKNLVQAYNEFLNGLLGYFLIGWRCALGKPISTNVFSNAYGAKLNEFAQLTNGESGAFYLIFRLAKPTIRNAIAHSSIWLDHESWQVRFTDRSQTGELSLIDFIGLAAIGSHLPQAYLVAIAAIAVLEEGSADEIVRIPPYLVQVFRHRSAK